MWLQPTLKIDEYGVQDPRLWHWACSMCCTIFFFLGSETISPDIESAQQGASTSTVLTSQVCLSPVFRMTPLSVLATHYLCPQCTAGLRTLRKPAAAAAMHCHVINVTLTFSRTFSDRPPFKLQNGTIGSICVQDLVVGTASLTMSLGSDTDAAFDHYVQHIAHQHVADNEIKAQRLLLFRKHGKRRIINIEQIQAHLKSAFRVDVDVIDISRLTFHEQIKQVRNVSIVISPCGGLSFSSVFLPAGGVAIFPGYWDPVANSSANMEEYIYDRFTTFSTMYYNVGLDEISVDADGAGFDDRAKYRDYGSTILHLDKLTDMVHSALLRVEGAYGWHNSFHRKRCSRSVRAFDQLC